MKKSVTIDEVIDLLNSALELDRPAVAALIANRIPCNEELASHSTIQCSLQHGGHLVGMLGILNGLFGVDDKNWGGIAAVFDHLNPDEKESSLIRFEKGQGW